MRKWLNAILGILILIALAPVTFATPSDDGCINYVLFNVTNASRSEAMNYTFVGPSQINPNITWHENNFSVWNTNENISMPHYAEFLEDVGTPDQRIRLWWNNSINGTRQDQIHIGEGCSNGSGRENSARIFDYHRNFSGGVQGWTTHGTASISHETTLNGSSYYGGRRDNGSMHCTSMSNMQHYCRSPTINANRSDQNVEMHIQTPNLGTIQYSFGTIPWGLTENQQLHTGYETSVGSEDLRLNDGTGWKMVHEPVLTGWIQNFSMYRLNMNWTQNDPECYGWLNSNSTNTDARVASGCFRQDFSGAVSALYRQYVYADTAGAHVYLDDYKVYQNSLWTTIDYSGTFEVGAGGAGGITINSSTNFTDPMEEDSDDTFYLNITLDAYNSSIHDCSDAFATLEYNGVNYSTVEVDYGNCNLGYSRGITTPLVNTGSEINYVWYFGMNLTNDTLSGSQSVTLNASQLHLVFTENVTVQIFNVNQSMNQSVNSSNVLELTLRDLPQGEIKIRIKPFELVNTSYNWSQYYEFLNNLSKVNQTIDVYPVQPQSYQYIRMLDFGNSPLRNAYIEAWKANPGNFFWDNYTMVGQRLTDDEGYAYFQFNEGDTIRLVYHKDGYETGSKLIEYVEENLDLDKADAIVLRLNEDLSNKGKHVRLFTQRIFSDRTVAIPVIIHNPLGSASVTVTTQYALNNGFNNATRNGWTLNRDRYNLTPTVHFEDTGFNNISLLVYSRCGYCTNAEWQLDWNATLIYLEPEHEVLATSTFDGLVGEAFAVLLWIALIVVAMFLSFIFPNTGASKHTIMLGGLIIVGLYSGFIFVAVAGVCYYMMRWAHKVMSE